MYLTIHCFRVRQEQADRSGRQDSLGRKEVWVDLEWREKRALVVRLESTANRDLG